MADLLYVGAEFETYDDFSQAFQQYCQTTQVNGEAVKFVHSAAQYIKNGTLSSDVQNRLTYVRKAERCKFRGKTSCDAGYKLMLHTKVDGHQVLRLDKFNGAHNSHIEFVQYKPILPRTRTNQSDNSSQDKLQKIVKKIADGVKRLPNATCDAITEILESVWYRTEKNITYKVDFTDNPPENSESFSFSLVC